MTIVRTNAEDLRFRELVQLLDAELAERDGEEHVFYASFNTLQTIRHVVLVLHEEQPIACGAIKAFDDTSMEVKRMYTLPTWRNRGIAALLLAELEKWTTELSCTSCVLETGLKQPEAIRLYEKCGYVRIPNYGQYQGVVNSVCFRKDLRILEKT